MSLKNILLAEDHNVVMLGVMKMLHQIQPDADISCCTDFPEVVEQLEARSYDLLILDINIPGGDKPAMVEGIRRIQPDIRILIFSGYDESLYAFPYLEAGADGFLSKTASESEFKKAIDRMTSNQKYLSPKVQQQSIDQLLNRKENKRTGLRVLTEREVEIVNLMIKGASTAEIGHQLHLQPSTVSTHKMRIFKKLSVSNLVELIEYVKVSPKED